MRSRCPIPRVADINESWYLVDGKKLVLGRMASRIALRLQGKMESGFTPHMMPKIHVVVVNADKVALTGRKREKDRFYHHTGYPGGIKSETYRQTLEGEHPERLVIRAVRRMLPKRGPRAYALLKCLRAYRGEDHPHGAQSPIFWDLAKENRKNLSLPREF